MLARYKMSVGRRISSATLIADARHSWLDALSSAGALAGLVAVALGWSWGDPAAGIAVTVFICHVGYEVTADVMRRLADGVEPDVITRAEAAAGSVHGVVHADLVELPEWGSLTWTTRAAPGVSAVRRARRPGS